MKSRPDHSTRPAPRANDWLDARPVSGLQANTQFTNSIATTPAMIHCHVKKPARFFCLAWLVAVTLADSIQAAPGGTNEVVVLEKEGRVEAARANAPAWTAAQINQTLHIADRVRTGERSRATLHLLDQSTLRMFELSEFLIEPLEATPDKPVFSLSKGLLYFFHRDKPVDVQFKTRTATAAIRGTEFHLAVADNGRTVLTMFDGEVDLSNALGAIQLKSGEQGLFVRVEVKFVHVQHAGIVEAPLNDVDGIDDRRPDRRLTGINHALLSAPELNCAESVGQVHFAVEHREDGAAIVCDG